MDGQGLHRRRVGQTPPRRRRPWPELAARLAEEFPISALEPSAIEAIRSEPKKRSIAIACSGGADSVALVLLLWAHFPNRRGRWRILHFDHRLRGRISTQDARFAKSLAHGLGEECAIGRWTERPKNVVNVSEDTSRQARMQFFSTSMKQQGARLLLLGHHANDVAESMVMRLVRGSGAGGLCAPRPVHVHGDGTTRIRPFLSISAGRIRAALAAHGIPWREDASNQSDTFFRNRVRTRVIPEIMRASEQDALAGFGRSRSQLQEDDEALESWLESVLPESLLSETTDFALLAGLPRALLRRAIHRWIAVHVPGQSLSRRATEMLIEAISKQRDLSMSAGRERLITVSGTKLAVSIPVADAVTPPATEWPWSETVKAFVGMGDHSIQPAFKTMTPKLLRSVVSGKPSPEKEAYVDAGGIDVGTMHVRTRQPGDKYHPLGGRGRRKLQDMFVDAKIPRSLRADLPVVCAGENILWVPGFPPTAQSAIHAGTERVVQLTYY